MRRKNTSVIICYACDQERHKARECPKQEFNKNKPSMRKRGAINQIIDSDGFDNILNKSNSIYINSRKFEVIFDTGAFENFISKDLLIKLSVVPKSLIKPVIRYAVDGSKIVIKEKIIDFTHEEKLYSSEFYIIEGRCSNKILIGREWMQKSWLNNKEKDCQKLFVR